MDSNIITQIVLFIPSLITALIALGVAVSNWRRLPLEIEKQKQALIADNKLTEATLSEKIQSIYEKETLYLRTSYEQRLQGLQAQVTQLEAQLKSEREEHQCELDLLKENYEHRIEVMQKRIGELESQVRRLEGLQHEPTT